MERRLIYKYGPDNPEPPDKLPKNDPDNSKQRRNLIAKIDEELTADPTAATREFFESNGLFAKLDTLLFDIHDNIKSPIVAAGTEDQLLTAEEQSQLIDAFKNTPTDRIEELLTDIGQSKIIGRDKIINFDALRQFLTNLQDKKTYQLYIQVRSRVQHDENIRPLVEIVIKRPENLEKIIAALGKRASKFIESIGYNSAEILATATDIKPLLEVADVFTSDKGPVDVYKRLSAPKFKDNPDIQAYLLSKADLEEFVQTHEKSQGKKDIDEKFKDTVVKEKIKTFHTEKCPSLMDAGLYVDITDRGNGIIIRNRYVLYVTETLEIDFERSIENDEEDKYFFELLRQNNIMQLEDINIENVAKIQNLDEQNRQANKLKYNLENTISRLRNLEGDRTETHIHYGTIEDPNIEVSKGYSADKFQLFLFYDQTGRITRTTPEFNALLKEYKISNLEELAKALKDTDLLEKIGTTLTQGYNNKQDEIARNKSHEQEMTARFANDIAEINEKLAPLKLTFHFPRKDYDDIVGTPTLQLEHKIFKIDIPVNEDGTLNYQSAKFTNSTELRRSSSELEIFIPEDYAKKFITAFSKDIITIGDFKKYYKKISAWLEKEGPRYDREKEKWKQETERMRAELMKEKQIMETEISRITGIPAEHEYAKIIAISHYIFNTYLALVVTIDPNQKDDKTNTIDIKIEHDPSGKKLKYSMDYHDYASREALITAFSEKFSREKQAGIIENFFNEDFYELKQFTALETIREKIAPSLAEGFEHYTQTLIDAYFGKTDIPELKHNPQLLNYLFQPKFFYELSPETKKQIFDEVDRSIQEYSQLPESAQERKIMLKKAIEKNLSLVVAHITTWSNPEEERTKMLDYLRSKLNNCGPEINPLVFKHLIAFIKGEGYLGEETRKELLEELLQKKDQLPKDQQDEINMMLSDVSMLRLAPEPIRAKIINDNLALAKTTQDSEALSQILGNLSKLLQHREFAQFSDSIIDLLLKFFEENDTFAATQNQQTSKEAKTKLERQAAFLAVKAIVNTRDKFITDRVIDFIKRDKRIGGLLLDQLMSQESEIKNAKLLDFVQKEIAAILPQSPNYDEILRDGRITFRLYFLSMPFFKQWQDDILGAATEGKTNEKGFKVTKKNGFYIYSKTINGIPFELQIEIPGESKKDFKNNVFETINDRNIDGVVYFGHAGGGNELAQSLTSAPANERNEDLYKIILLSACGSMGFYGANARNLYPKAHVFGNRTNTYGVDDGHFFANMLEGIAYRRTYAEMHERLQKQFGKFDYTKKQENLTSGIHRPDNLVWPHQKESLSYRDSDGDGVMDGADSSFDIDIEQIETTDEIRFELAAAANIPRRNLLAVKTFINGRFLSELEPFGDVRFPEKNEGVGWFNRYEGEEAERMGRGDIGDEVIKVSDMRTEENIHGETIYYFDLEISAAYKFCSDRVLKALVAYELAEYFLKNYEVVNGKPKKREQPLEELSKEQKYLTILKGLDNMMHEYHSATPQHKAELRPTLESIFVQFREKYHLPAGFTFELAYKWAWSKKYFGNSESWQDDELLSEFRDKYHELRDRETDLIAQTRACESIMRQVDSLFEQPKS